ncbi:MAG: hypothetical protein LM577_02345 [Thermoproteaceae archaeon]|jgi:arginine repressor|nr:hypothetical protein [Thermoproteaceae archaeon]
MIVTIIGNLIDMLLKRQEIITSDDIKALLKRLNMQVSDEELARALIALEIHKKVYVRRVKREGRDVFQISRRR